ELERTELSCSRPQCSVSSYFYLHCTGSPLYLLTIIEKRYCTSCLFLENGLYLSLQTIDRHPYWLYWSL
ncbi:hypothetical protein EJ08DRAFT_681462, partial [Tothia fuscella]